MKKIFLIILAGIIGFYSFSFAWNEFTYENAKKIANEYIRNSSFDENWQDQNPTLSWEGKYFYTESETPSYIEFKVSCDKNPDCGFIMVNFDGDDVAIPIASTSENTPSEVLAAKNESKIEENRLYYFSPFEQYAENNRNGNIASIDPQDDFWFEISENEKFSLEEVKTKKNNTLKEKIESNKKEAKIFKESVKFKEIKKELKEKKQTNGKEEVSFKYLGSAMAWWTETIWNSTYIIWSSTSNCNSRVPCYTQFSYNYSWWTCLSGCSPTAVAMLFWYHDRVWNYPNLVPWTATDYIINSSTNTDITNMINSVRLSMWTYCSSSWGWATPSNQIWWALAYPKSKWYINTQAYYGVWTPSQLLNIIKSEINNGNPIIINTIPHTIVVYWYNHTTWSQMVRANYWWWNGSFSNIDININSINVKGTNYTIHSTVRFDIK